MESNWVTQTLKKQIPQFQVPYFIEIVPKTSLQTMTQILFFLQEYLMEWVQQLCRVNASKTHQLKYSSCQIYHEHHMSFGGATIILTESRFYYLQFLQEVLYYRYLESKRIFWWSILFASIVNLTKSCSRSKISARFIKSCP